MLRINWWHVWNEPRNRLSHEFHAIDLTHSSQALLCIFVVLPGWKWIGHQWRVGPDTWNNIETWNAAKCPKIFPASNFLWCDEMCPNLKNAMKCHEDTSMDTPLIMSFQTIFLSFPCWKTDQSAYPGGHRFRWLHGRLLCLAQVRFDRGVGGLLVGSCSGWVWMAGETNWQDGFENEVISPIDDNVRQFNCESEGIAWGTVSIQTQRITCDATWPIWMNGGKLCV